jgi:hypothetical protein
MKPVVSALYRWVALGLLGLLVVLATAFANRDVYSKQEADARISTVRTLHDRDIRDQQRQLDRIDGNVQRLVDQLIEEDN